MYTNRGRIQESNPEITANLAKDKELGINWFLNSWNTGNKRKALPVGSGYTAVYTNRRVIVVHYFLVAYSLIVYYVCMAIDVCTSAELMYTSRLGCRCPVNTQSKYSRQTRSHSQVTFM